MTGHEEDVVLSSLFALELESLKLHGSVIN